MAASSDRDQQLQMARDMDRMSTALIDFGTRVVKKNPIKVGGYIIGLLICLFFNGFAVNEERLDMFQDALSKIDYRELRKSQDDLYNAQQNYYHSQGWFWSCDR
jgi:hypothetical protein